MTRLAESEIMNIHQQKDRKTQGQKDRKAQRKKRQNVREAERHKNKKIE